MTTVAAVCVTPLAATLECIGALDSYLAADLGPLEAGWFPASALIAPGSPELAEGLARSVARYPGAEARVAGSFFAGEYAWYLCAAATGAYLSEGRVPDLAAENVALRYRTYTWHHGDASGEAERIDVRFLSGRFAALPDDPAADHPDAEILPDATALRERLREGLEAHLAPVIAAVTAATRLGQRAQWNLVADAVANCFLVAGKALGDAERAQAEGLACIKAPGSPMRSSATSYLTVEAEGHSESFCSRGGCCLYYRIKPGENCSTCVLRPQSERIELLRAYLLHKHSVEATA